MVLFAVDKLFDSLVILQRLLLSEDNKLLLYAQRPSLLQLTLNMLGQAFAAK